MLCSSTLKCNCCCVFELGETNKLPEEHFACFVILGKEARKWILLLLDGGAVVLLVVVLG